MLVPIGMYRARLVEVVLTGSAPGSEHVQALFEILEGEYEGHFAPWYGFFSEVTARRTIESLRYCGWRGVDLANLEGVKSNDVTIEVEHWLRDGKSHARVAWVFHASRLTELEPMPPERARAFADRMRPFVLSLRHRPPPSDETTPVHVGEATQPVPIPDGTAGTSFGDEIVPF